MPASMAPKPEENTKTKDVTYTGWETDGPKREYFTLLAYMAPATLKGAEDAARTAPTLINGRMQDGRNWPVYCHHLFTAQLKGWRLLIDPATDPVANKGRIYEEDGYFFWRFTPQNVADLPWDIQTWLIEEITNCGGVLTTSKMITVANDKTLLDFRGTPQGVAAREIPGSADPK